PGFASQADLASLFVERARDLLSPAGTLGFLLPAKLWRSLSGGGCRRVLSLDMRVAAVEDCSDAPPAFDAAVYPSMLVATRDARRTMPASLLGVYRRGDVTRWRASWHDVALDGSPGSPWLLVPPEVRAAFDRVERAGAPLGRSPFGRPWLGVKSGCNAAFVVHWLGESDGIARITDGERTGEIEASMLRPLVRGETLTAWRANGSAEQILWTHDDRGPVRALPPGAARWLAVHRRTLERRSDARGAGRWWSLFRTESADCGRARVVWSDFGRRPRAAVLAAGDPMVPLNTCYTIPCPSHQDALALAALFNSPLAAAWLAVLAEPARGGYRRFLGWTMARFPLPADWPRARALLAPLAESALRGDVPSSVALQNAALAAYRLRPDVISPLLEWMEAGA
ncbi:MAG TPA: hypothetical protein VGT98_03525, partial [Candidatus Elarobacter sp.]|nr:hypothetical protein [Candidatus Elarobacter sp.]